MAKEAGFDKKIITKAEKELKAKVEAVEEWQLHLQVHQENG
jgi:hypothetical protein